MTSTWTRCTSRGTRSSAPPNRSPPTEAVGRVAAEQITPYPPGIPAILPGERITADVLDYLRTGLTAGMVLPDPTDPEPGHPPGHRGLTGMHDQAGRVLGGGGPDVAWTYGRAGVDPALAD